MSAAILRDDHVLLLRAALLEGDAARDAYARWRGAVDFESIDGNALRLVPLLYRNLRSLGCTDSVMSRMKGIWRRVWVENHSRIDTCKPAIATLAEAGIATILLKGAAMIAHWLDDAGVRPMSDFDVLVPRPQARAAIARLTASGWTPHLWRADRFDEADFDAWHGAAFRRRGYEIDLHWRALRDGAAASGNDAFWARAIPASLDGQPTRVLAAEDHFFHACVHGATWAAGGRIDWAADASLLMRAAGTGFDWSRVEGLAHAQRLGAPLEALLATLRDALGLAVPHARPRHRVSLVERLEFNLRRRPPHRLGRAATTLLALQDFRRRGAGWLERPLLAALPAFGRDRWQIDRARHVPGFAAFVALGRPAVLRALLAGDVRPALLARRDLPDLSATRIAFADESQLRGALVLGWSVPEATGGRWTDGNEALIALRAAGHEGDLPISLRLRPYALLQRPPVSAQLWANDERVATWSFAKGDGTVQTRGATISAATLARRAVVSLALRVRRPGSPAALGISEDMRRLGLFVEELRLAPDLVREPFARPLLTCAGSPDAAILWDGWCMPEADGCWTTGSRAGIRLRLPAPAPRGIATELHGSLYVPSRQGTRTIVASVGGVELVRRAYRGGAGDEKLSLVMPADAIRRDVVAIDLEITDAPPPAASGDSADPRPIGFHLQRLVLRAL